MRHPATPARRAQPAGTNVNTGVNTAVNTAVDNTLESVAIVARILGELALGPGAMGVTELARALDESKARIHRNLTSLKNCGLVDQEHATERYRLGWKLFQLGERAALQFELRSLADDGLKRLRDLTGQSALLSVPVNGEALVIATADNHNQVSITVKPGNRPVPHCSAQGRIALAWSSAQQRERLFAKPLAALTPHSITDPAVLRKRMLRIRERLYETAPNEALIGINVIAAPVLRDGEELVGIIAIVGSIQDIPVPHDAAQLRLVQGCAAALSGMLGGNAYRDRGIQVPKEFLPSARR